MNKLVSIIIPCYNSENTVLETIDSAVNQTYSNIEIIIVDDGSTDDSLSLLKNKAMEYENLSVYSKSNEGLSATRNFGFSKSSGDYVIFLDSDDLLDKTYVEECISVVERFPDTSVVCTQTQFFERKTGLCKHPDYSYSLLLMKNCLVATALINSSYLRSVGLYDVNLKFAEDWELWIRLLNKYPKLYQIEKPLFYYRKRLSNDSMTDRNESSNNRDEYQASLYIYQKHYDLYCQHNLDIINLLHSHVDVDKYKKKYYNVWYKRFFYFFSKNKRI